jgi:amino acid permease
MSVISVINLCISLLILIISFVLSLQSNLLWDALYRSFIVSIISFIFIYFITVIYKQFVRSNQNKQSSTLPVQEQRDSTKTNEIEKKKEIESDKGGHVDLQTPDDDEQFIPLQPQKLNIQNDKQED